MEAVRDEHGDDPPITALAASTNGKIAVRVPRSIHAALLAESKAEGVSLNQLIVSKLAVQLRALV
jgi:predicted HicB family RNase H-like nuclease